MSRQYAHDDDYCGSFCESLGEAGSGHNVDRTGLRLLELGYNRALEYAYNPHNHLIIYNEWVGCDVVEPVYVYAGICKEEISIFLENLKYFQDTYDIEPIDRNVVELVIAKGRIANKLADLAVEFAYFACDTARQIDDIDLYDPEYYPPMPRDIFNQAYARNHSSSISYNLAVSCITLDLFLNRSLAINNLMRPITSFPNERLLDVEDMGALALASRTTLSEQIQRVEALDLD